MFDDYIIFFGILLILYSNETISLTQLFILLALLSTLPCERTRRCRRDRDRNINSALTEENA